MPQSPTPESWPGESLLPPSPAPARGWLAPLALGVALLSIAAAAGLYWHTQSRLLDLEVQLARRIGEFDNSAQEARTAAREARSFADDLLVRLTALEGKAQEAQNQQLALASMYQELARSQDERVIADIEQTLLLAQQQLLLAGNVRAAVLALEAIDARLARLEKPQFTRVRDAIAKDISRLKLLPAADVVGINARLDTLIQNIDQLKPEHDTEPPQRALAGDTGGAGDWLTRLGRETWQEIKQLVRIRRLDHPELPLLTPQQSYFLRQNLKLRLLSARLALLQRDEATFQADLAAAKDWVGQYFNPRDPLTASVRESLAALQATPVAIKDADLGESLKALQGLRERR